MASFFLELKSICKGYRLLTMVVVLLVFQLIFLQQANHKHRIEINDRTVAYKASPVNHERNLNTFISMWERGIFDISKSVYEDTLEFKMYHRTLAEKRIQFFGQEDWPNYNLGTAESCFIQWENFPKWFVRAPQPQDIFADQWADIRSLFNYPRLSVLDEASDSLWAERLIWRGCYHLYLYQEDLPPARPYGTSPWTFVFNFLREGLPTLLGLVTLLMTVNLVHRDRKSGAIKAALTVPSSRNRYLLRKLGLGFAASWLAVLIPHILTFTFLGLKHGFRGLGYPVLLDKGVSSWRVAPELLRVLRTATFEFVGMSQYITNNAPFANFERLHFVPLWQFLLLAVLLLALFILFCTALGLLISVVVKNELLAHVAAIGVFALGLQFGSMLPGLKTSVWDLFSKANVIPLLEGNHTSTYLASAVVLVGATLAAVLLSCQVFRRSDVA